MGCKLVRARNHDAQLWRFFVNERGTSSTFLSLLTKQDVLDAPQQQPYSNFEVHRLVGGGVIDKMPSAMGWIRSKLPAVRGVLENVPRPIRS
ncbi:MAG: hypothetical protein ACKPKO_01245, partial [Candidatus Fonsibacter sp.]